jgi:hypothetical protein
LGFPQDWEQFPMILTMNFRWSFGLEKTHESFVGHAYFSLVGT